MTIKSKLKVVDLPFSSIKMHPEMEDYRTEVGDIKGLASSIKEEGLNEPIGVQVKKEKGKNVYYLVYGKRRYIALQMLKKKGEKLDKISCVILSSANPKDLTFIQLVENVQRKDFTISELSKAVRDLIEGGVMQVEVAKKLGLSRSYISRVLSLTSKASESLREAVDTGVIGFNKASDISELTPAQQDKMVSKIVNKEESKDSISNKARKLKGKSAKIRNESKIRIILSQLIDYSQDKIIKKIEKMKVELSIDIIQYILNETDDFPIVLPIKEVDEMDKKGKKLLTIKSKKDVIVVSDDEDWGK